MAKDVVIIPKAGAIVLGIVFFFLIAAVVIMIFLLIFLPKVQPAPTPPPPTPPPTPPPSTTAVANTVTTTSSGTQVQSVVPIQPNTPIVQQQTTTKVTDIGTHLIHTKDNKITIQNKSTGQVATGQLPVATESVASFTQHPSSGNMLTVETNQGRQYEIILASPGVLGFRPTGQIVQPGIPNNFLPNIPGF